MGVTLLQWNANSLQAHLHELKHFLDDINFLPKIICVQETFLKPSQDFSLPGYSVLRKDGENGKGGVAILLQQGVNYGKVHFFDDIEGISVEIDTIHGPLQIINFYVSPSKVFDESLFQNVFDLDNVCICGDFNAKSTLWGSPKADRRGKSIENILQRSNLVVLNTGSPTRYYNNGESHIDLTFASPRYSNIANWEVLSETCGSDHNVIKITFETLVNTEQMTGPKWLFHKADWPKFRALCDSYLSELNSDDEMERLNEDITAAIVRAATESIPQSSGKKKKRYAPFWNEKCSQVVKERERAKRALKIDSPHDDFIEYKRLKAIARKTIKSEKRKTWRSFCSSLSNRTKLTRVWNVVKNMNNCNKGDTIPAFEKNGKTANTNLEKANVLGNHFAAVSSTANYTTKFKLHKENFENKNKNKFNFKSNTFSVLNVPYKMSELKKALKKCKNTAPGKDRLCYEMFKHMSSVSQEFILNFFNRVWEKGSMPTAWKHALIIPVLKPNKMKNDPASYRPIALTSNFCKLMERMIVMRLNWYLEKSNLLNVFQSGFRKNRNTVDQLLRLSDDIVKGLGNKSYVLGVFLDFEKAYDMVWRKGVLYKLHEIGLDGNIFNWINSFLSDRSLQVRIGTSLSDSFEVENGLPQGSVISPVLFLVMINDLCPTNMKYSLFADDAAIWKSGKNLKYIQNQVQAAMNEVQKWCNKWGFKVSIAKTNVVLFHKGKFKKVSIFLNGQRLKQEKSIKFLGMIFDHKLSWKDHVDYLVEKCQKRINVLKALTGSKWGADKETMVILYKTFIRSVIDYGSIIYCSASPSILKKLDVVQSQALRLCCGALKCTPVCALEVECGIPPLQCRRKLLVHKTALKYKYTDKNPTQECFDNCYQLHYGKYNDHFKPIKLKVAEVINELPKAYTIQSVDNIPSWEYDPAYYDTSLHTTLSKQFDNPPYMLAVSLESMQKYNQSLHIYTDGSKCDNKTACAFYVPCLKFSKQIRLPDNTSIFVAEMIAILESLQFLLEKPPISCVIFSDSLSSIQSLESGSKTSALHQEIQYCIYQLWCQGVYISISWIPSHVGIRGNEYVDGLAKEALFHEIIDNPVLKDISDIYKKLEKDMVEEWQSMWDACKKGRFYHKVQPTVSLSVKYSDLNREKQTAITRLRFGKSLLGDVLHMIGQRDNDLCEFCNMKEDVQHFLRDCGMFEDQLVELNDKMLASDVVPSLETILGCPRWYNDLWIYICQTGRFK